MGKGKRKRKGLMSGVMAWSILKRRGVMLGLGALLVVVLCSFHTERSGTRTLSRSVLMRKPMRGKVLTIMLSAARNYK